ncbi:MAG: hypothetical protein AB8G15_16355 [Saprospiraceae bacterium]
MKQEEILDELGEVDAGNGKVIQRIIFLSLSVILVFILIDVLVEKEIIPIILYEKNGVEIRSVGLLLFGVLLFFVSGLTPLLNLLKPRLSIIKVVVLGGGIIFCTELVFKVLQQIFLNGTEFYLAYLNIFSAAGLLALPGVLFINHRIHKLNAKSTLFPNLLIFAMFIIFWLLATK